MRSVRYRHIGLGMDAGATVTTYDRAGRRAELLGYLGDDLRSRLVYTYDERGRNTGWEDYHVARGGGPHMPAYSSPPGTPLPAVPERRVYVLDEAGRRTEERELNADGTLRSRSTFTYDSAGRLHEREDFDYRGQPTSRWVHEYDAAGRPRERRMYSRGQEFRTIYEFNADGGLVLEEHSDGAGMLDWRWAVRYDTAGRKRAEEIHESGQPRWRIEYRYDAAGRVSERETHDLQPRLVTPMPSYERGKVAYTYLPDGGRLVETFRQTRDGSPDGRVVERLDAGGRRVEREEFNADGTRTRKLVSDPAGGRNRVLEGRTRWTEELDAHGNWIRRAYILIPDDGGPPHTLWEIVREIAYW